MRKMLSIAKYRGIGLLELMLSLAIIAILLIMAVRYFQSANNSNAMNTAIDDCNAIKSAVKAYVGTNNISVASKLTLSQLVTQGFLPNSFGSTAALSAAASPWGSSITIGTTSGPAGVSCTISSVPTGLCTDSTSPLVMKALGTLSQGETATCDTGTFVINYLL